MADQAAIERWENEGGRALAPGPGLSSTAMSLPDGNAVTEPSHRNRPRLGEQTAATRKGRVMNKLLAIVFDDERSAYEGVKALKELHAESSVTLYATAVIAKGQDGAVGVKQSGDEGPLGTVLGFITGSLIGLLGGPVGAAVGGTTGAMLGMLSDLAEGEVGTEFIERVSRQLSPGKTAVVAEVDEEWSAPIDARMEALRGVVFRRPRGEVIDARIERDIAAANAEIEGLEAADAQAIGGTKAELQARIDDARKRLHTKRRQIKETIEAIRLEGEAKVRALEERAAGAEGETKATLEQRIAEARSDHEKRVDRLSRASGLVKEPEAV
jgi:uncharacterized membrane protein